MSSDRKARREAYVGEWGVAVQDARAARARNTAIATGEDVEQAEGREARRRVGEYIRRRVSQDYKPPSSHKKRK